MGKKHGSVKLFVDNSGAVDMSKDYVANNRTRHIERRHLKIRELVQRSIIDTQWIKTDDNVADIFTKYLEDRAHSIDSVSQEGWSAQDTLCCEQPGGAQTHPHAITDIDVSINAFDMRNVCEHGDVSCVPRLPPGIPQCEPLPGRVFLLLSAYVGTSIR